MYVGRFAPSPTGPLHFGSLVAALASYMEARSAKGKWLLRMEDLDKPREQPGAADAILRTLDALGLHWDGAVEYQSRRIARYRAAMDQLENHAYPCGCTRSEMADSALAIDGARVYGGTCRGGLPPGKAVRSVRVRAAGEIRFTDRVQGDQSQVLERDVGDFVLCRADGQFAYQLAVVVDDARQGVTEVVRGEDLLASAARQQLLQQALGLPGVRYCHVPLVLDEQGRRLAKRHDDLSLAELRAGGTDPRAIVAWAARSCGLPVDARCSARDALPGFSLQSLPLGAVTLDAATVTALRAARA
jgi:glutamyl-Q tRNA(Asp) synthetase